MKLTEIKKIAKDKGLKIPARVKKGELIQQIQRTEGNFDCFGTAAGYCDQYDCIWREDCLGS